MKDLAGIFEAAGCTNVRTYIQSGNVVFEAPPRVIATIPKRISIAIGARFGHAPVTVLRSASELRAAIRNNPFIARGIDSAELHVMFLAGTPDVERLATLEPDRSPGDTFEAGPREIYLHLPNGVADTKLTNAYFDAKLGTTCTGRNWRTILALAEIAGA